MEGRKRRPLFASAEKLGVDRVWETSPHPLAAFKRTDSELQLEGGASRNKTSLGDQTAPGRWG